MLANSRDLPAGLATSMACLLEDFSRARQSRSDLGEGAEVGRGAAGVLAVTHFLWPGEGWTSARCCTKARVLPVSFLPATLAMLEMEARLERALSLSLACGAESSRLGRTLCTMLGLAGALRRELGVGTRSCECRLAESSLLGSVAKKDARRPGSWEVEVR